MVMFLNLRPEYFYLSEAVEGQIPKNILAFHYLGFIDEQIAYWVGKCFSVELHQLALQGIYMKA